MTSEHSDAKNGNSETRRYSDPEPTEQELDLLDLS
jgi:hypothetical protein